MSTKGVKGKEPIRFGDDKNEDDNTDYQGEIEVFDSEIINFDEIESIIREGTKASIRESLKQGNFEKFMKDIRDYGNLKWTDSEAEEFFTTAWDHRSIKYLAENFDFSRNYFDKVYINTLTVKELEAIRYLRVSDKLSLDIINHYIVLTNYPGIFQQYRIISKPKVSYHKDANYCCVPKEVFTYLKIPIPHRGDIVELFV